MAYGGSNDDVMTSRDLEM